jgi:hypothetical protein
MDRVQLPSSMTMSETFGEGTVASVDRMGSCTHRAACPAEESEAGPGTGPSEWTTWKPCSISQGLASLRMSPGSTRTAPGFLCSHLVAHLFPAPEERA